MNKLIRDKIPGIMKKNNQKPQVKIIKNDSEYLLALNKKLIEEVNEYLEASSKGDPEHEKSEIADILEVIEAICKLKKYNSTLIQAYKLKKKNENGGFEKRILLLSK